MVDPGDRVRGIIDRISKSGNGIIEFNDETVLNIGPIPERAVGLIVPVEVRSGTFDLCLEPVITSNDHETLITLRESTDPVNVTVDHVTNTGCGIVQFETEYLNIGPVTCSSGATVSITWIEPGYGYVQDANLQGEQYQKWVDTIAKNPTVLPLLVTHTNSKHSRSKINDQNVYLGPLTCSPGDILDIDIIHIKNSPVFKIGYAMYDKVKSDRYLDWVQNYHKRSVEEYSDQDTPAEEGTELTLNEANIARSIREQYDQHSTHMFIRDITGIIGVQTRIYPDKSTLNPQQSTPESQSQNQEQEDKQEPEPEHQPETPSKTQTPKDTSQTQPSESLSHHNQDSTSTETDLVVLREAAENAAAETATETTTTTQPGSRYNRSRAVKDYAKARADGDCEGCENPAPFLDPNHDPYLEVHHVHELSKGGDDDPDSVIALCPTCHARVHYGANGRAYNEELKEKVAETLSKQGRNPN